MLYQLSYASRWSPRPVTLRRFLITNEVDCYYPTGALVPTRGIEPLSPRCHRGGLPLTYAGVVGTTGFEPAISCTPSRRINHFPTSRKFWGDRRDSHPLYPGSQPGGSSLCLRPPRKSLVHLEGIEPSFFAYQANGLPLTYRWMERPMGFAPTWSSLATRCLTSRLRPHEVWLPRQESNLQLAVSKAALRTDTECVAVVQGCGIEPPIHKARVLQTRSVPTRTSLQKDWWTRGESNSYSLLARQVLYR